LVLLAARHEPGRGAAQLDVQHGHELLHAETPTTACTARHKQQWPFASQHCFSHCCRLQGMNLGVALPSWMFGKDKDGCLPRH
jgi:hypothetical protein